MNRHPGGSIGGRPNEASHPAPQQSREHYLSAIVAVQQSLIAAGPNLAEALPGVLATLGQASGVRRAYYFEAWNEGDRTWSVGRAEWCAPGVQSRIPPGRFPLGSIPDLVETLRAGEPFAVIRPQFGEELHRLLTPHGVRSNLLLPLLVGGEFVGGLGFDDERERVWGRAEIDLLRASATALSSALEQRRAILDARETDARFRALAERGSEVFYRYRADPPGFEFISNVASRVLGISPQSHYEDPWIWHHHVDPDDRDVLERILHAADDNEDSVVIRFHRPDGDVRWIQHFFRGVRDARGRHLGISGLARDVTEQQATREALLRSEARYRALMDAFPEAVLVHAHGRLLYANPAALRLLAVRSPDQIPVELLRVLVDRQSTGDRSIRRADGTTAIVEVRSLATALEGIDATMVVLRDLTERRKMEAQLFLSDRLAAMGTMSAGIAHEINNPLASAVSNIAWAREEIANRLGGGASVLAALDEAEEGLARVGQIVRELHGFAASREDRDTVTDLHAVLETAIRLASNEIRHRARLVRSWGPPVLLQASEARLCQVFVNLLVNAAHAIREGDAERNVIEVRTSLLDDDLVACEVRDTGSGIPEEVRGRIFDLFFTTKPVGKGTGLGLAICHSIVTGMGGRIELETELGKGSTFRVVLPRFHGAESPAPHESALPELHHSRILIVDDDPAVGAALRRLLSDHDVEFASGGAEALERLEKERFDVVLCDVMMPNMGGFDLWERVKSTRPELATRFAFITGGAFTERTRELLQKTTAPTLFKPFTKQELLEAIQAVLAPA